MGDPDVSPFTSTCTLEGSLPPSDRVASIICSTSAVEAVHGGKPQLRSNPFGRSPGQSF